MLPRVRMRGLGLLLALALVGGAAGWWYAAASTGPADSGATPGPVTASDPALPYTPPEKVNEDSDQPPVAQSLATYGTRLGRPGRGGVVVPVPLGWERHDISDHEARWVAPGNPPGSYSVRIAVVDLRRTLAQVVAERATALEYDTRISDLTIESQEVDTLRASFILSGYRELQITRWLSFDGNGIDLEISATGRLIDEPGLEALVAKVATEVRRQQPPARPLP